MNYAKWRSRDERAREEFYTEVVQEGAEEAGDVLDQRDDSHSCWSVCCHSCSSSASAGPDDLGHAYSVHSLMKADEGNDEGKDEV